MVKMEKSLYKYKKICYNIIPKNIKNTAICGV